MVIASNSLFVWGLGYASVDYKLLLVVIQVVSVPVDREMNLSLAWSRFRLLQMARAWSSLRHIGRLEFI